MAAVCNFFFIFVKTHYIVSVTKNNLKKNKKKQNNYCHQDESDKSETKQPIRAMGNV